MLLINNLYGDYDESTAEGRGANAATNLMKYFNEAKKIAEENGIKLQKGEIDIKEACKNEAIEKFSMAYIPYTEVDEETGNLNTEYGMAFSNIYLSNLDNDNDGVLHPDELGPVGHVVDQIDCSGRITKSKLFAWLIFQDCVELFNGIITPNEAAKAYIWAINDPAFVVEKLREIYKKLELKEKEESFSVPQPVRN